MPPQTEQDKAERDGTIARLQQELEAERRQAEEDAKKVRGA